MVWTPLFWIVYDIYKCDPLINGFITTNYDHGESIYKVFNVLLWWKSCIFKTITIFIKNKKIRIFHLNKIHMNIIFEPLSIKYKNKIDFGPMIFLMKFCQNEKIKIEKNIFVTLFPIFLKRITKFWGNCFLKNFHYIWVVLLVW